MTTLVKTITQWRMEDVTEQIKSLEQPTLFKGLFQHWPAVEQAQHSDQKVLDYVASMHSPMPVSAGEVPAVQNGRLFYNEAFNGFNFHHHTLPFDEFLSHLKHASRSTHNNQFYLGSTPIKTLLPKFLVENTFEALDSGSSLASIWMSNRTQVAAHQDLPNNLAVCVSGERKFTLFPPEQINNLYIGPIDNTPAGQPISLVDIENPDIERYPRFKQALTHAQVAELSSGDALFIPSLWWHSVKSTAPINILVNFWWQNATAQMGAPMDALLHTILNIKGLPKSQKQALKQLFDYYVFNENDDTHQHIPEHALGVLDGSDNAARKIRALLLNHLSR